MSVAAVHLTGRFESLDPDHPEWDVLVRSCREWHPFYLSGFVRAEAAFQKVESKLLVFQTAEEVAVYPVLLFPFVNEGEITYDLRGQLYAGPISSADNPQRHAELINGLRSAMKEAAPGYSWVTDFCRLNPFSPTALSEEDVRHTSDHVYVDLTRGYERIWKEYEPAARRNVKGANRRGAEMRPLLNETEYLSFAKLYQGRMDDLEASARYRYSTEYFRTLSRNFSDHCLVVGAFVEGQIVAGALSLKGNGRLFSHLLAWDAAYRRFKVSTGLLDLIIRLGIQEGCESFVLGGGVVSGEDKVFAYKKSLSREVFSQVRLDIVLDKERYQRLCAQYRTDTGKASFFPPYRQMQEASRGG